MLPEHICLVMEMEDDGRLPKPGKHRDHPPHDWWYTSWGGGHQMNQAPEADDVDYHRSVKYRCPGR